MRLGPSAYYGLKSALVIHVGGDASYFSGGMNDKVNGIFGKVVRYCVRVC